MADTGLVFITSQTGTSVTNFTVNNCFSSLYSRYRLIVTTQSNGTGNCRLQLTTGGTPRTSNYTYAYFQADGTTTTPGRSTSSYPEILFQVTKSDGSKNISIFEIQNPFSSTQPTTSFCWKIDRSSIAFNHWSQGTTDTTSYDGVKVMDDTGTFTTATLYVYGYKNS